jgi:nucleotide-binding universal stress UspA family protein
MYDTILVPTDGSDASMEAVDEAVELAGRLGGTVHVLSVVEQAQYAPMNTPSPDFVDSLEANAREALDRAVDRAEAAGAEGVEGTVEAGTAHEAIVSYVDEADVDLVVMGTHGRTGLDRVLLGSVTEKVVRLSPVPVLTVRPGEGGESGDEEE